MNPQFKAVTLHQHLSVRFLPQNVQPESIHEDIIRYIRNILQYNQPKFFKNSISWNTAKRNINLKKMTHTTKYNG